MPDNVGLIVAFALPVVALVVLRINAVMVFLSLCLGSVLVEQVGDDANVMLNLFSSQQAGDVSKSALHLILLFLPVVLTSMFMLFSVKGRAKIFMNILPAAGASFLGVLLAVPLLSPGLRYSIQAQPLWYDATHAQALVVGASAIVSLLFLWMQRKGSGAGKKHH